MQIKNRNQVPKKSWLFSWFLACFGLQCYNIISKTKTLNITRKFLVTNALKTIHKYFIDYFSSNALLQKANRKKLFPQSVKEGHGT